ncbi:hypothetical protein Hanom_Chr02g00119381 [Helianthus anomalus]
MKVLIKQRQHTREPVGDGPPLSDGLINCLQAVLSDATFPSPSAMHPVLSATGLLCLLLLNLFV